MPGARKAVRVEGGCLGVLEVYGIESLNAKGLGWSCERGVIHDGKLNVLRDKVERHPGLIDGLLCSLAREQILMAVERRQTSVAV